MLRRITIEYDPSKVSFADSHKLTGAMCQLEELCKDSAIAMEVIDVRGKGVLGKRPRSDKKDVSDLVMQPQQKQVISALKEHKSGLTKPDLSEQTGISLNSLGGVLNTLKKRGLVDNPHEQASSSGGRNLKLWQLCDGAEQDG